MLEVKLTEKIGARDPCEDELPFAPMSAADAAFVVCSFSCHIFCRNCISRCSLTRSRDCFLRASLVVTCGVYSATPAAASGHHRHRVGGHAPDGYSTAKAASLARM